MFYVMDGNLYYPLPILVQDSYQKVPDRPLPVPPTITPAETALEPCPWNWLEYMGLTSLIVMILAVIGGVVGCCCCCRGTGGTSNI